MSYFVPSSNQIIKGFFLFDFISVLDQILALGWKLSQVVFRNVG